MASNSQVIKHLVLAC